MELNELNLTRFEDYGSKISRKISINKSFGFGFPPAFYREQGLDKFSHLQLFIDQAKGIIGLHFAKDPSDGKGFSLAPYADGDKRGANCIARSFFNKYNIDPKRYYGRYDFATKEIEGVGYVYLIQLKENTKIN